MTFEPKPCGNLRHAKRQSSPHAKSLGKRESAKRDLITQWVWYAENAGIETADSFLKAAAATATMLATQPDAGYRVRSGRQELQDIRRFPISDGFEKILLFYIPLADGIELIRVIHGNRDLDRLFMEGLG